MIEATLDWFDDGGVSVVGSPSALGAPSTKGHVDWFARPGFDNDQTLVIDHQADRTRALASEG